MKPKKEYEPKDTDDIRPPKGFGFWVIKAGEAAQVYMIRCFKCATENYGPAVASGICYWCHHDANANHKSLRQHTTPRVL